MIHRSVNIVALKDDWILHEIAQRLTNNLSYSYWSEKPVSGYKITYYINYAQALSRRVSEVECALFTHIEERVETLVNKWNEVSALTDVAICMSEIYAKKISKKLTQPIVIPPGVDLVAFKQRPIKIGVIGRTKKTGRKGEKLLKAVMDIEGIEWLFTGDGWPSKSTYLKSEQVPNFYQGLDYVLVPSYYEGGPMSVIEALASGVPVIAPPVGWVPELPHIPFKLGDEKSLRKVLENLVKEKSKLRESVKDRTWDNFIRKHDILFNELQKLNIGFTKRDVKKSISNAKKLF